MWQEVPLGKTAGGKGGGEDPRSIASEAGPRNTLDLGTHNLSSELTDETQPVSTYEVIDDLSETLWEEHSLSPPFSLPMMPSFEVT